MATVYLAIQESFEREVALKIMSPQLAEEQDFSERFLREARIVSKLVHPNIVTVHDVGIENGHHYLSMQYIDGQDLKRCLPDMSAQQIFRALKEIATALNYAGGKGYVHRDVKPDNIMINGEDGRAILMDFGIARASRPDNSMTRTGTALGTPHYMSPEQARGAEVDGRSDLYSLGVLFYYLLAGKVPFEADSPVAVGIKHLTEPVPTLPAPLSCYQPLVNKLMAKKPEQRYQTGSAVCEALDQLPLEPLDEWHKRSGFEFKNDGSNTPVRNTVTEDFTSVMAVDPTVVAPAPKAATARRTTATSGRAAATSAEESLHIPREDLAARAAPRKSAGLPLLIAVLVLAGAGVAAYFLYPEQALQQWQRAQAWINQQTGGTLITPEADRREVATAADPQRAEPQKPTAVEPSPATTGVESGAAATATGAATVATASQQAGDIAATPAVEEDPLQPLFTQIDQLTTDIADQPERRGELLDLYRQVLEIDPDNVDAGAAVSELRSNVIDEAQQLLDDGELEQATAQLITLASWFPDIEEQQDYQALQSAINTAEQVQALLAEAEHYFQADQLLKPDAENAVASYRAALALDENNAAALAGLQQVAERYRQLALVKQKAGAYSVALKLVASGLSVSSDDAQLLRLRDQLRAQYKKQQAVEKLLAQAAALQKQQQHFASGDSAAAKYLEVLKIDKGNKQAAAALKQLLTDRYAAIEQLLSQRKFDEATARVEEAQSVVPNDERLAALMLEIESSKPAIETLLLSGAPIDSLYQDAKATVSADRILHIAIHYKNLADANTVFQAQLFDGSRSLQIAAVPVVVSGSEGDAQFRIERPVEGFTEGGYHIDILLAGQRIYSQAFRIAR